MLNEKWYQSTIKGKNKQATLQVSPSLKNSAVQKSRSLTSLQNITKNLSTNCHHLNKNHTLKPCIFLLSGYWLPTESTRTRAFLDQIRGSEVMAPPFNTKKKERYQYLLFLEHLLHHGTALDKRADHPGQHPHIHAFLGQGGQLRTCRSSAVLIVIAWLLLIRRAYTGTSPLLIFVSRRSFCYIVLLVS